MSAANGADPLLVETIERLLADVCTAEEIERAEHDGWSPSVWSAYADAGFALVGVSDGAGGAGGSLYDVAAILRAVGKSAAPIPAAETGLLGGWLLAEHGLPLPSGPITLVDDPASVSVRDGHLFVDGFVAWARHAERIVALLPADAGGGLVSLRPDQVAVTPGANLAGEARDRVVADVGIADVERGVAANQVTGDDITQRGAFSRVLMAAGALSTMAQMTIDYTNERRQFGKPVATFQAVQLHLVTVAQSAVRADMAAAVATRAMATDRVGVEVAAARVVVDDAITVGTRAAHQAHGAMGVTREYPLHQFTRRLWAWRHEFGGTSTWCRELGNQVGAVGPDKLFAFITQ